MNTTGTITPGGPPVTVTVANAGDTATLTFSGTTGQRISLNMTNSTIGNFTTVTIKNPTGGNLKSGSGINFFLDAVPLAASGTYSIVIDPSGTLTGNITLTLYDVPSDFAATTTPGVGPVTVTTSVPGQNGLILFNGSTGQRVSLNMTNSTIGNFTTVTMRNPGGGRVTGGYGINFFLDTVTLPADGTYSIAIDPNATLTGHITLTLYDVPTDFTTTIAPGGPSVAVTTTVPGQNGRLTFVGTAGQTAFLSMTNSTIGNFTTVRVKNPTGATIRSGYGINFSLNNISLPADGTYSIEVARAGRSLVRSR